MGFLSHKVMVKKLDDLEDDTPTDYREFEVLTWSQRLKESQDETLGDGHAMAGFQISHV